jgi:amino acid adenylation domain-containing protein
MISIIDSIYNNAKKIADKIIFIDKDKKITNKELLDNAKSIASGLLEYNNQPIAIYMDKGVDLITTMMGVTLSGNFYTVIDSKMPKERIELILDVLKPKVIITNLEAELSVKKALLDDLKNTNVKENELEYIHQNIIDTNPMYVLFTSGSTGVPKGVVVSHKAVMAYLNWFTNCFDINVETIFGNQTPLYFSMSVSDVLGTIYSGATLYFIPTMYFSFPIKLLEYLNDNKVNTIYWVPSALSILANLDALNDYKLPELKKVLFAGEVMPTKVLNYWMEHIDAMYADLFGPTETTDICTYYKVNRHIDINESIPIGVPCNNCGILIIKEDQEVKPGEVGELYVKGSFLADGYYNNPEKTKEVFVQNPINKAYPEVCYKTGDLVKMGNDGNIIYISRKDFQIKHMGYRIELGEIENRIYTIKDVITCCTVYVNDEISLYYEGKISEIDLINELKLKLPNYMMPNNVYKIAKMSYNMNGKVDRNYFTTLEKEKNCGKIN